MPLTKHNLIFGSISFLLLGFVTLADYLRSHNPISLVASIILFAALIAVIASYFIQHKKILQ